LTKIEINDVSLKGFTSLLNYIYSGDKTIITRIQDLEELFELFHLSEKYFLTELKTLVSETMLNLPFSVKNYAAVFTTVAKHENLLHTEELCQDLLERCAIAVKKSWKTVEDSTSFWSADYDDDLSLKAALCKRIATVRSTPHKNSRCAADLTDGGELHPGICQPGRAVKATNYLISEEGYNIPRGSMGFVCEYVSVTNSGLIPFPILKILWNGMPDISSHRTGKNIIPVKGK
jgi:hypothetical protein